MARQYTPSLIGYVSEFHSQPREQCRPIMERKQFRANAGRALYGCGRGEDGTPHRSLGDFGTVNAVEMGLGYAF